MAERVLLVAGWVVPGGGAGPIRRGAVRVRDGRIAAVGPLEAVGEAGPEERVLDLGGAVVVPGLVNAHQHGRGLSQLALGYPDDALEPWIAGRRRHGAPDVYALTRLAAEAMLANGVTATLHGNYSYASGDYEAELRDTVAAYRDAGIRATVCVGMQDRGALVYPDRDEGAFVAGLPEAVRRRIAQASAPAYIGGTEATIALMERLLSEFEGERLVAFAYGPAGPQWVRDETWTQLARDAAERGVGLHFHLLESPAQAASCRRLYPEGTLERLEALGAFAVRASCAHAVHATAGDLDCAARNGLAIVANPGSNMRLGNGVPPVDAFLAAGCVVALGTDNTGLRDDEDYLGELRLGGALARAKLGARVPDAAGLLAIGTEAGARAAFLEPGCGVLQPGAPADLAAFDAGPADAAGAVDPLDRLLTSGSGADCRLTMVAGTVRYAARDADRERLAAAREAALAAAAARPEGWAGVEVTALQAALRRHYGEPAAQ